MGQLVITLMLFLAFFGITACIANESFNKNLVKFCCIMVWILVVSLMVVTIGDAIVNYGNTPLPCR